MRWLPFVALIALSLLALAIDASRVARLPTAEDWAGAAAALRLEARTGDVVQPWPVFLERARQIIDAAPIEIEEDLSRADWVGAERVWLLSAPLAPFTSRAVAEGMLAARGAVPGQRRTFGAIGLQPWDLTGPRLAGDLTGSSVTARQPEFHEVDYIAHRCRRVRLGSPEAPERLEVRGTAGTHVHLRAGVLGEYAYRPEAAPVHVEVRLGGQTLAALDVGRTVPPEPGWRAADASVPPGEDQRTFELFFSSRDPSRPVCVAAWTTR